MGKRSLVEHLERIHRLNYGNKSINEGFVSGLLTEQVQDNKKADTVKDDVGELFTNIENSIKGGGISQEERGTMNFKKEVESMQIGLELLGYSLPRHGVDGFFGNETATAVEKYKQDNKILNESASALRQDLKSLGYSEKGSEITSGGEITSEISKAVSEILKKFKELRPDVTVKVTGGNDAYHKKVGYNSLHKTGNAIDLVLDPRDSKTLDDFLSVVKDYKSKDPKVNFIDEYRNPSSAATAPHMHIAYGGKSVAPSSGGSSNTPMVSATVEMLSSLLGKLRMKGVKDEDIKKYTNINTATMSAKGKELVNNPDFMMKIKDIANTIKVGDQYILKLMNHESHVDPTVVNSFGCVGLIQFCPDTKGSGVKTIGGKKYSLNELRNDLTLQLNAIKEFWRTGYNNGKITEPADLHIYNFFPIAAGKDDSFVLGTQKMSPESVANANPVFNKGLGRPRNTPLTVGDLKRYYKLTNMI